MDIVITTDYPNYTFSRVSSLKGSSLPTNDTFYHLKFGPDESVVFLVEINY